MAFTMKKRYPRATRFRKIMSPNLSLQQTRRDPIGMTVTSIATHTASLQFDRPVIFPSNFLTITGIRANGGSALKPVSLEVTSPTTANIVFDGMATVTDVDVPFEDPGIRDQLGAYVPAGIYQVPA